jgi:uncharacterized membrane protein
VRLTVQEEGRGIMWTKVRETLRWLFALEPVAVQGAVRAVLVVATALAAVFGFSLETEDLEARLVVLVAAVWALAEVLGALWARRRATPNVKVVEAVATPVERVEAGVVVPILAGEANPEPTGRVVGSMQVGPTRFD